MPLNRLPDVLLSNQTLTGVSADYLDGITSVTFSESLRANRNISGGGNITFDSNGNLYWSNRFIIISNGRGSHYATDGYFDAYVPTSGTINGFGGAATRTATGSGINLSTWDALYVVTPIGGVYSSTSYRIVSYTSDFEVPHDWVLIAVRNGDDGFVYLPNGVVLEPGQTSTASGRGNLKVGTSDTENYIAFRGTTGDNPGGFDHGFIGERIFSGGESSELLIFKGNDVEGISGPDRIRHFASNHVFDTFTSAISGTFSQIGAATSYTRLIIKQAGSVGIGTTSPDTIATSSTPAMLGIVSNAVGTTNLVLRTIASQTARLQQWQNSAGTVLIEISAGGDLFMSSATRAFFGGSSATGYVNISTAGNGARQGLVIQGSASQTANLQEWQDSTGLIKSYIDLAGNHWIGAGTASAGTVEISSGYFYVTSNRWDGSSSVGETFGINNFRFGGAGAAGAFALHLKPTVSSSAYLSIAGDSSRSVGVNVQYPSASSGYGQFGVQIQDPSYKGIVVRGAASQTANLQEWQNNSGTVIAKVDSNGSITAATNLIVGNASMFYTGGNYYNSTLSIGTQGAGYSGIVIRGQASQTADLQQWQNSAGTILAKVDASGYLSTSKINFTGGTSTISALTLADGTVSFESTAGQLFSISNSLTGTIFSVNDISGLPIIESTDAGIVKINELFGQTVFGSGTPTASSLTTFVARTAATIPIVVKGATSQTANLQEWQNSAGYAGTAIDSGGSFYAPGIYASYLMQVTAGGAAVVPMKVKGAASQTANLQEWQNSAGTALVKIDSAGKLDFGSSIGDKILLYGSEYGIAVQSYAMVLFSAPASAGRVSIRPGYGSGNADAIELFTSGRIKQTLTEAGSVGNIIKAAASQTANLQEWQSSDGTVLSNIGPNGTVTLKSIASANIATFFNGSSGYGAGHINYAGTFNINGANMGFPYTSSGATLNVNAVSAGSLPLSVRGYASQTADLQQWQNSSGTVIASISSNGAIVTSQGLIANGSYASSFGGSSTAGAILTVNTSGASIKGLIVKAAASQTANLQEWQDSSGTVKSAITASGSLELNGKDIELMNIMGAF